MSANSFWVYIIASQSRVLYIGVTNDLIRRIDQHRRGIIPGFSRKYRIRRLVHYERADDPVTAITREKQLKGWRRSKKVTLIEETNRTWADLWESTEILTLRG